VGEDYPFVSLAPRWERVRVRGDVSIKIPFIFKAFSIYSGVKVE